MALIVTTYCPQCGVKCATSDKILEGHTVVWCRACDEFRLEGDTKAVKGDSDQVKAQLRARLEALDRERAAMESDFDDPRWIN